MMSIGITSKALERARSIVVKMVGSGLYQQAIRIVGDVNAFILRIEV